MKPPTPVAGVFHRLVSPEMKNEIPVTTRRAPVPAGFARIFDIVNGFLIDAATWRRRSPQRIGEERVAQSG